MGKAEFFELMCDCFFRDYQIGVEFFYRQVGFFFSFAGGVDGKLDDYMVGRSLLWGDGSAEFCVGFFRVILGRDAVVNVFGNFFTSCFSEF